MGRRVAVAAVVMLGGAVVALAVLTALHAGLEAAEGFDRAVQGWVHGWASPGLTAVMLAMTGLGAMATFLPAVAVGVVRMASQGEKRRGWLLGGAMLGAVALNEGLKAHFHRARPGVAWAMVAERTYSFPSGHALFAVTLYGTLLWLAWAGATGARRVGLGMVAGFMVMGVGVSRVYLGAHWPTDVLAGYAVGAIWVATVIVADKVSQPRTW